ncbi:MAG: glycine cleavage system aminomethyltransferase GcvT [Chloroflexi bacterium]|nr:glycine cleavage system aminomethyltransferase GcvT [Chloroflexota bacterium]
MGARLVEFGGWEMPVQYTGIMEEHQAVRTAAGLFDISHMGEFFVTGAGAESYLNQALTNDVRKLCVHQAQYTLMCNGHGGVIDDLYVYRIGEQSFLLVVNASRIEPDFHRLETILASSPHRAGVELTNASALYGALAVQGPRVAEFIDAFVAEGMAAAAPPIRPTDLKKNQIGPVTFRAGALSYEGFVARTGYTGEDGFEIVAPAEIMASLWQRMLDFGSPHGLKPAGLGARDTLRTEVCYPLYGHELDEQTTPLEAGLGYFVALEKPGFAGRSVLAKQKADGVSKKCVAFKMTGRSAPPRPHYPIWSSGAEAARIGEVSSGTQSPTLGLGIGLGYVPTPFAGPGTHLEIEIRGKRGPAVVVSKPIYRKAA